MEFSIVFDCESIIESRKSIKESPDYFTFVTEYGDYEVDFQISFLLSKSIRDLLHSDKTCYKYEIPRNSCTKDFYKCFFDSLSTNIINIPINLIKDFITISQILQIKCFQQSIEKAIISVLCDSSDQNDEAKFIYLCQNISSIDIEKLKYMPDWFIRKLISNATFSNEDDRAKFLIQNEKYLGIEYFEQLKFDELSKVTMNQIITILERAENADIKESLMPKLMNRLIMELSHLDIYILNISTKIEEKPTFDLNFLYELNKDRQNKKYSIYYKTLYDTEIESILKNDEKYLKSFDIVILGGIDAFGSCCSECFITSILNAIKQYRMEGGIVFNLHDIAFGKSYDSFSQLYSDLIGFKGKRAINIRQLKFYSEVQFNESSEKKIIMSSPFIIEHKFVVSETHYTLELDPQHVVIWNKSKDQHYYAENLDQNFADCAICHTTSYTIEEKKFFYNAICHLYESCHNHIPNSI